MVWSWIWENIIFNNSVFNIFAPFNYFNNFIKFNEEYYQYFYAYDNSKSFTNLKGKYFISNNDFSVGLEFLWIPGFEANLKNYYFLAPLINNNENNIFQLKMDFDNFNGYGFKFLFAAIEKKEYDFSNGFYFIVGAGNNINISDNIVFFQEATIYNGQNLFKTEKIQNFVFLNVIDETKDSRFFIEYNGGINFSLPYDMLLTAEYFFNSRGLTKEYSKEIYSNIKESNNQSSNYPIINSQYISLHKDWRWYKHYIAVTFVKSNIAGMLDINSTLIFSPQDLGFFLQSGFILKFNSIMTIENNLIFQFGVPESEFGLELYNVILRLDIVIKIDTEIKINKKK